YRVTITTPCGSIVSDPAILSLNLGEQFSKVSAGLSFTLWLKTDGTVWAAGNNTYNQLGNGNNFSSVVRVPVSGLSAIDISAGGSHGLALMSDGTVRAWGTGGSGQLGNNTLANSSTPVTVLDSTSGNPLTGIIAISAGSSHS